MAAKRNDLMTLGAERLAITERALSQFLFLARNIGYVKLIISGRFGVELSFQCSPLPLRFRRDFRFAPTGVRCQEGETLKQIGTRTAECRIRLRRKYRSNHFSILRFLVLRFDLPAIASRSGEAGGYSVLLSSVLCPLTSYSMPSTPPVLSDST
jgi:hypothetical protein